MFSGAERRHFIRLSRSLPIEFSIAGDMENIIYKAFTNNISHGGICVDINESHAGLLKQLAPKKSRLIINMAISENIKLENIVSMVYWVEKPRKGKDGQLGLEFETIEEKVSEQIHSFILNEFITNYGG